MTISKKTTKLAKIVEARYGVDLLSFSENVEHLKDVAALYDDKRTSIKIALGESAVFFSDEFTKAYLISEAARMILREIAPKRPKKFKKGLNTK